MLVFWRKILNKTLISIWINLPKSRRLSKQKKMRMILHSEVPLKKVILLSIFNRIELILISNEFLGMSLILIEYC